MGIIKKLGKFMDEDRDQITEDDLLTELTPHKRVESYNASEMISCAKCRRSNPPNRLDCLYCGVKLEISKEQIQTLKPILRKADSWKPASNVIYVSKLVEPDEIGLKEAAKMIRIDPALLAEAINIGKPLPLARSEQQEEIDIVVTRLKEIGIETVILADDVFNLSIPTRRLGRVSLGNGTLEMQPFNQREIVEVYPADLKLIVTGALFNRRIESTEKHSRKNENKILETAETTADELLIDIYFADDKIGYRVSASGFDFSCLNEKKSMIANENVKSLVGWLREFAPLALFDGDYPSLRGFLSNVWEVDEHTDSKGLKRRGLGGYRREMVTTTDNNLQFTKYSRLRRHLI